MFKIFNLLITQLVFFSNDALFIFNKSGSKFLILIILLKNNMDDPLY